MVEVKRKLQISDSELKISQEKANLYELRYTDAETRLSKTIETLKTQVNELSDEAGINQKEHILLAKDYELLLSKSTAFEQNSKLVSERLEREKNQA